MWLLQCLYSHQEYSSWETDEVIVRELVRNLGIALACVFLTTLLLLANFLGSVIVLLCVAVTLVSRSRWQIRNWTQFDNVYQQGWLVWLHAFLGPHRGRHQCRGYYHSYWALCWLCRCFFFTNICSLLNLTRTFPPQCTSATPSWPCPEAKERELTRPWLTWALLSSMAASQPSSPSSSSSAATPTFSSPSSRSSSLLYYLESGMA